MLNLSGTLNSSTPQPVDSSVSWPQMSAAASRTRLYRSASAPHFPETFRLASACLRKAARTAEAFRTVCGRGKSVTERRDVLTMCARQCRQVAKGVMKFISTSKFWSRPKFRRGHFCPLPQVQKLREVFRMIKTVNRIFQEYAERLLIECGFTKFAFCVLSVP